jgi:hypothetical protein
VTGSNGRLFLYGIVVGAVGMAALSLLLAAARRTSRRGSDARHSLRQSRQETAEVSRDRDDLLDQRETAREYTAGAPDDSAPRSDSRPDPDDSRGGGPRQFGRRPVIRQATAPPEPLNDQVVRDVPADTPAP